MRYLIVLFFDFLQVDNFIALLLCLILKVARFFLPFIYHLLNVSMIAAGYFYEDTYGPMALVYGVLVGGFLQLACQIYSPLQQPAGHFGGTKRLVKIKGQFIDIKYEVPSDDYFKNPKKLDGEYKLPYLRFTQNKELKRLPNGFVVFTPYIFKEKKEEIDKSLK